MELVEIFQPLSKEKVFANIATGECFWEPPPGANVKKLDTSIWWELFDSKTSKCYYYNPTSEKTVWKKPCNEDIIPLAKLQKLNVHPNTSNSRLETKNAETQTSSRKKCTVQGSSSAKMKEVVSVAETAGKYRRTNEDSFQKQSDVYQPGDVPSNQAKIDADLLGRSAMSDKARNYETKVKVLSKATPVDQPKRAELGTASCELAVDSSSTISLVLETSSSNDFDTKSYDEAIEQMKDSQSPYQRRHRSSLGSLTQALDADAEGASVHSSRAQLTPQQRRRFPRTNPAYVASLMPGTGDRKYVRKASTELSVATSVSSGSLNRPREFQSGLEALNDSFNEVYSAEEEEVSPLSKSALKQERAIDCPVFDRNGNDVTMGSSASLQELNNVGSKLPITGSYTLPNYVVMDASSSVGAASGKAFLSRRTSVSAEQNISHGSTTSATDQGIYRQRGKRFEERGVHRRQSSESDLEYLHSPLSKRMSVPLYGSGSQLSINVDQNIVESLNEHRIGIRRKTVSVVNMLSWTKDPIRKPMFRTSDKVVKKEAVEVFRLIQTYMGDRPCKYAPSRVALEIATKGWTIIQLRDEVYVQLTRQVTDNPHEASLIRGWELLGVCLSMFPPSSRFSSYLDGFIAQHMDPDQTIDQKACVKRFAVQCHRRLERVMKLGARRGQKPPSVDEIEQALKSLFQPTMFGGSLSDIIQMQAERFPKRRLPWIQTVLSEEVLRRNGPHTEGIFRVSGDIDEVNILKTRCEQWIEPTSCTEPHTPASLLKLWYRELHEPIIPDDFYDECVSCCQDVCSCISIVHRLPALNRLVFSYLIRFLQVFVTPENVVLTKMDANNIAMIWAPNCLRCQSDNPLVIFENARKELLFLRNVIENLDTGFMQGMF